VHLFRRIDRHGNITGRLTPQSVCLIVQKHCNNIGLDSKQYGAHSLRSGFCFTAAKVGKNIKLCNKQGIKKLESLQRYIKATLFNQSAVAGIGL